MTQRIVKNYKIATKYSETKPLIPEVQKSADSQRSALGFLASSVYEEYARNERLYVLVNDLPEGRIYAGHLLFDMRYPRATIRQMFIAPGHRRGGLATFLLDHLRDILTSFGFTSIYARVALDLLDSNIFWEKQRFYIQRQEKGGATKNRKILVRCHELESPQLFPTSGINSENPLGLTFTPSDIIPLYLLDLNVLFDLAGPRRKRHDNALSIFQAERMNFCRLAISTEIREELKRTRLAEKTDPMEGFIDIFPSFPLVKPKETTQLISELSSIVFPHKQKDSFSSNDWSDLSHVATAIQHDLAGLITNDAAILSSAPLIKTKYGIEIISTAAFELNDVTPSNKSSHYTSNNSTLNLLEVKRENDLEIHKLLSTLRLTGSTIASGWIPTVEQEKIAMRRAVWSHNELIGYLTWSSRSTSGATTARLAVDETSPHALHAARILLIYLLEQLTPNGPTQVNLELPSHQSHSREIAVGFGFKGTSSMHCLTKLVLGQVITQENWSHTRDTLSNKSGLKLPIKPPIISKEEQYIQILTPSGNREHVSLEILESSLSPALFCLPGRPAVITPVQRSFSEPLLGHSLQGSFLPFSTASLFQDRHYVSSSNTLKHFKTGTLIFFYESTKQKGRCELVAIARVRQAYLKPTESLDNKTLEQSVLDTGSLSIIGKSKMKTITVFDNIFPLPNPVPLRFLQEIGCGKPTDLITTKPISDYQLEKILQQAFQNEKR